MEQELNSNLEQLADNIVAHNIQDVEKSMHLVNKDTLEYNFENENTLLHYVFSSNNQRIIKLFIIKLEELFQNNILSDGQLKGLLENNNIAGFTPVDRILQTNAAQKINAALKGIHNPEILDAFLDARNEDGQTIHEVAREELPAEELKEFHEKMHDGINHISSWLEWFGSFFLPSTTSLPKKQNLTKKVFNGMQIFGNDTQVNYHVDSVAQNMKTIALATYSKGSKIPAQEAKQHVVGQLGQVEIQRILRGNDLESIIELAQRANVVFEKKQIIPTYTRKTKFLTRAAFRVLSDLGDTIGSGEMTALSKMKEERLKDLVGRKREGAAKRFFESIQENLKAQVQTHFERQSFAVDGKKEEVGASVASVASVAEASAAEAEAEEKAEEEVVAKEKEDDTRKSSIETALLVRKIPQLVKDVSYFSKGFGLDPLKYGKEKLGLDSDDHLPEEILHLGSSVMEIGADAYISHVTGNKLPMISTILHTENGQLALNSAIKPLVGNDENILRDVNSVVSLVGSVALSYVLGGPVLGTVSLVAQGTTIGLDYLIRHNYIEKDNPINYLNPVLNIGSQIATIYYSPGKFLKLIEATHLTKEVYDSFDLISDDTYPELTMPLKGLLITGTGLFTYTSLGAGKLDAVVGMGMSALLLATPTKEKTQSEILEANNIFDEDDTGTAGNNEEGLQQLMGNNSNSSLECESELPN
jgi:hypothetical protein